MRQTLQSWQRKLYEQGDAIMDREDITHMAREAGFVGFDGSNAMLRKFAAFVAAAEREACAKEVEDEIKRVKPVYSVTAENALKAIRARSKQ